ncbi:MAG: hypothetical protein ACK4N4_04305 [Burkholderiales bacterium]
MRRCGAAGIIVALAAAGGAAADQSRRRRPRRCSLLGQGSQGRTEGGRRELLLEIGEIMLYGRTWRNVRVHCPRLRLETNFLECADAVVDAGAQIPLSFRMRGATRRSKRCCALRRAKRGGCMPVLPSRAASSGSSSTMARRSASSRLVAAGRHATACRGHAGRQDRFFKCWRNRCALRGRWPGCQTAVRNLSALGGAGAAAAIEHSVLRFFGQFGYEKAGLSCKLRNNVCEMDGVENAPQGYVSVKGGGIPALSVIGYNRHVGWRELVERLRRIRQDDVRVVIQ